MTENQHTDSLQAIQTDLDVAISQLIVANIYCDSEVEDVHLSNSMIALTHSLSAISTRLAEYPKPTAIAPSVESEGGASNG